MLKSIDIEAVTNIAKEASQKILKIYNEAEIQVETKMDGSPVTLADKLSDSLITERLLELYPEIPVLSEEGKEIPYEERMNLKYLWLVDPLDGTNEFIKRNGEFTVNISLIENNTPVLGVMAIPVQDVIYYARKNEGAWKKKGNDAPQRIFTNKNGIEKGLVMIGSRSNQSSDVQNLLDEYISANNIKISKSVNVGSTLKICLIAEGKADFYPRFGRTWEWDTAAGQCIIEEAGGRLVTIDNKPLLYNKKDIRNPYFFVYGN